MSEWWISMSYHPGAIISLFLVSTCLSYVFIYLYAVERSLPIITGSYGLSNGLDSSEEYPFSPSPTNPDLGDEDEVEIPLPVYNETELKIRFAERRANLGKTCRRRYGPIRESMATQRAIFTLGRSKVLQSTFFVDEVNHVLACVIAKVGSTNWKKLLLYNSYNSSFNFPQNISEDMVNDLSQWPKYVSLKPLSALKDVKGSLKRILSNYTKVVWVRNPLIRLVSAWNSKLTGHNTYYGNIFGGYIIKKYRKKTKKQVTDRNALTNVTLEEFFSYLVKEIKPYQMSDVHWSIFNTQCMPCYIDYDYVGKLENWYPEAFYMLSQLNKAKRGLPNETIQWYQRKFENAGMQEALRTRPKSSDTVWKRLLKTLPKKLVQSAKQTYWLDFDLFGYNANDV